MKVTDDSKQLTQELLGKRVEPYIRVQISPTEIPIAECMNHVAAQLGVSNFVISHESRTSLQTDVRHCTMFALRKLFPKMTFREVGTYFNRTHGPTLLAIQRIQNLFDIRDSGGILSFSDRKLMEAAESAVLFLKSRLTNTPPNFAANVPTVALETLSGAVSVTG